jgi:tetratricopeptide (TPR) repeat protein
MRCHVLFDRTERLFSAGQKALAAQTFEAAIGYLESAIATDTAYSHLYLYLGIAKGELGQLDEASVAIRKAIELDPRNFVFPMELGIRFLDAGQAKAAFDYFTDAARLAPDNPLVSNYLRLASWELGEGDLEEVIRQLRDIPSPFRSRLLLRLAERLITRGQLAVALDDPVAAEGVTPVSQERSRLAAFWWRRTLWKARRLIDRGDAKGALWSLTTLENWQADAEVTALVQEVREAALAATRRELSRPAPGGGWLLRLWWRLTRNANEEFQAYAERWRRTLRVELAQLQLDLDRTDDAFETLAKWRGSFVRSGSPKDESVSAALVFLAMARIEILRGDDGRGIQLCVEARDHADVCGIDWIEGMARLHAGDRRSSRRLFEAHLRKMHGSIEPMVRRVVRLLMLVLTACFILIGT